MCASDPCLTNTRATGIPQQQTVLLQQGRLAGDKCQQVLRAPIVTAAMVWEQVRRLLPKAAIGLAPRTTTLVNLQTIMWIDAARQQNLAPLTIFGKRVSVHITLTTVRWDFGDDQTDDADGPGKPYDKTNDPCRTKQCSHYYGHTYARTGSMTITATAGYHATCATPLRTDRPNGATLEA